VDALAGEIAPRVPVSLSYHSRAVAELLGHVFKGCAPLEEHGRRSVAEFVQVVDRQPLRQLAGVEGIGIQRRQPVLYFGDDGP
jgi:hypothetical protein